MFEILLAGGAVNTVIASMVQNSTAVTVEMGWRPVLELVE